MHSDTCQTPDDKNVFVSRKRLVNRQPSSRSIPWHLDRSLPTNTTLCLVDEDPLHLVYMNIIMANLVCNVQWEAHQTALCEFPSLE